MLGGEFFFRLRRKCRRCGTSWNRFGGAGLGLAGICARCWMGNYSSRILADARYGTGLSRFHYHAFLCRDGNGPLCRRLGSRGVASRRAFRRGGFIACRFRLAYALPNRGLLNCGFPARRFFVDSFLAKRLRARRLLVFNFSCYLVLADTFLVAAFFRAVIPVLPVLRFADLARARFAVVAMPRAPVIIVEMSFNSFWRSFL